MHVDEQFAAGTPPILPRGTSVHVLNPGRDGFGCPTASQTGGGGGGAAVLHVKRSWLVQFASHCACVWLLLVRAMAQCFTPVLLVWQV